VIGLIDRLSRPLLRALDPEDAHALTLKALRLMPVARAPADPPEIGVRAFGLTFPNPVGVAPGFDKNAAAPDALLRLGFGFVEIGTVTPRPQSGNPRPRIFRLEADRGVINRLGFNNDGAPAVLARLSARARAGGVVGVNIGANKDSADRTDDYVRLIDTFAAVASYFTVNVSSPNTPGLRDLQQASALDDLLGRVIEAREKVRSRVGPTPVLLKIAPDLTLADLDDVVGVARKNRVDGMIVSNTTISRPTALRDRATATEQGGLSGRPLFKLSTRMLAETFVRVGEARNTVHIHSRHIDQMRHLELVGNLEQNAVVMFCNSRGRERRPSPVLRRGFELSLVLRLIVEPVPNVLHKATLG